jgi:hypothetical protein
LPRLPQRAENYVLWLLSQSFTRFCVDIVQLCAAPPCSCSAPHLELVVLAFQSVHAQAVLKHTSVHSLLLSC